MPSDYPDWFKPFLKEDAYNPTIEFLEKLEPQSRAELILKTAFLEILSPRESFRVLTESGDDHEDFYDSDHLQFMVLN